MVKNRYPLPLMNSTFERLQGASIFTKLNFHQMVFQALANNVLRETLQRFVSFYIDNITIFPSDLTSHIAHVKQVLKALLEAGLFVNVSAFLTHFLGIHNFRGQGSDEPK